MSEDNNDTAEVIKALRQIAAGLDQKSSPKRKTGMDGITTLDTPPLWVRDILQTRQENKNGNETKTR